MSGIEDAIAKAIWSTKPGSKIHPWASLGSIRKTYAEEVRAVLAALDALGYAIVLKKASGIVHPQQPFEGEKPATDG